MVKRLFEVNRKFVWILQRIKIKKDNLNEKVLKDITV